MIAHYLHTIVISGYYDLIQCKKWADNCILNRNGIESWVYDISTAKDPEELLLLISHPRTVEKVDDVNFYWEPDVIIGYYYLMFKENKLSLSDLYDKLTDEDDNCSESVIFGDKAINDAVEMILFNDLSLLEGILLPYYLIACDQKRKLRLFSLNQ